MARSELFSSCAVCEETRSGFLWGRGGTRPYHGPVGARRVAQGALLKGILCGRGGTRPYHFRKGGWGLVRMTGFEIKRSKSPPTSQPATIEIDRHSPAVGFLFPSGHR